MDFLLEGEIYASNISASGSTEPLGLFILHVADVAAENACADGFIKLILCASVCYDESAGVIVSIDIGGIDRTDSLVFADIPPV